MKIKIHKDDWYINAGIVGFYNIVGKENIEIQDEYIEFDSSILSSFSDKYFDYFMEKYNISKQTKDIMEIYIKIIRSNGISKKDLTKIKTSFGYQIDKIKKFNKKEADELKSIVNKVMGSETVEEVEKNVNQGIKILSKKEINEKLTSNKFKNILQNNFFGQVSFLNVNKSGLSVNQLKEVMNKDYIDDIQDYCNLIDSLNMAMQKDSIEDFSVYIEESMKNISDTKSKILKILKYIEKTFLNKGKSLSEIQEYLLSLHDCEVCGTYIPTSILSESTFATLGVSNNNARNFFWNQNIKKEICPLCKLIMFCIPAGVSLNSKKLYTFINTEGSIKEIISGNSRLREIGMKSNMISEYLFDTVVENNQKSIWQLSNTQFIEFLTDVEKKKSTINYFNIPNHVARFFAQNSEKLQLIKDYSFRFDLIDNIVKNKNLDDFINIKLKKCMQGVEYVSPKDCYIGICIASMLSNEEGSRGMSKYEQMRIAGMKVRAYYVSNGLEHKLDTIAYRLLNSIVSKNANVDIDIMRIIMSAKVEIPSYFSKSLLDVTSGKDIGLAKAFLSGMITTNKTNKEGENNE